MKDAAFEYGKAKMSDLGDELVQSMAQALAHAQGKRTRSRVHKVAIGPEEIQKARKSLGLSQDQFADAFGVSASTLRKWEQGQRAQPRLCSRSSSVNRRPLYGP